MGFPRSSPPDTEPSSWEQADQTPSVALHSACGDDTADASRGHVAATPEPLLTGAAALAEKARQDSAEFAEAEGSRCQGRYVIITEVDGQEVAFGPYFDEEAARRELLRLDQPAKIVELYSRSDHVFERD